MSADASGPVRNSPANGAAAGRGVTETGMVGLYQLSRRARWLVPAVAVAAVGGVMGASLSASAQPPPRLPRQTAAQLLAGVAAAGRHVPPLTGVISESANLGLPALPSIPGVTSGSLSWLSGTHTMQIWYGGPQQLRVAVPVSFGETDLRVDRGSIWLWQSKGKQATHILAAPRPVPSGSSGPAGALALSPQQAASKLLTLVGPTTIVGLQQNATVAGQAAYQLSLAPRSSSSLIGRIVIAIDATNHLPLRLQVFARGASSPALQLGYSSLSFGMPAASNFSFTAPPGATVKTIRAPGAGLGLRGLLLGGLLGAAVPQAVAPRVELAPFAVHGKLPPFAAHGKFPPFAAHGKFPPFAVHGKLLPFAAHGKFPPRLRALLRKGIPAMRIFGRAGLAAPFFIHVLQAKHARIGFQVLMPRCAARAVRPLPPAKVRALLRRLAQHGRALPLPSALARHLREHIVRVIVGPARCALAPAARLPGRLPVRMQVPAGLGGPPPLGLLPFGLGARVLGSGWLSVLELPAVAVPPARAWIAPAPGPGHRATVKPHQVIAPVPALGGGAAALAHALNAAATPVHGAWGSGRLLRTSLFSVLITKGAILIGAVDPAVLYAAAAKA